MSSISEDSHEWVARMLGREILLWSPDVQKEAYKHLDRFFATSTIRRGAAVSHFDTAPFVVPAYVNDCNTETFEDFLRLEHVAGLLIIKSGKIVLEQYSAGFGPEDRWTAMSMVKSVTSILVGCAIKDGLLSSLDADVARYVPELHGSAYEGVSLRNLLQMTSGARWDENYANPNADVNHYIRAIADRRAGGVLAYLKTLTRDNQPGSRFCYNTGDTFVLGCALRTIVGGSLAEYFSERIWSKIGAEQDATFLLESDGGQEVGGSCSNHTLRDYGRLGLFALSGGFAGGHQVLPDDWMDLTSTANAPISGRLDDDPRFAAYKGYGYSWWVRHDGSYDALGYQGQLLNIDKKHDTVIVILSALPRIEYRARGEANSTRRLNFINAVKKTLSK